MSKTGNYFCVIYSFKFRKKYDNLFKNKFRGEIEMNKLQLNSKKIIIWLCVNYGIFVLVFLVLGTLGHLSMIFDAKWQNFCVRKIPMPMLV